MKNKLLSIGKYLILLFLFSLFIPNAFSQSENPLVGTWIGKDKVQNCEVVWMFYSEEDKVIYNLSEFHPIITAKYRFNDKIITIYTQERYSDDIYMPDRAYYYELKDDVLFLIPLETFSKYYDNDFLIDIYGIELHQGENPFKDMFEGPK